MTDETMDKPPFDPQRAAFLLVAAVIAVHAIVVLAFSAACVWHSEAIIGGADVNCDPNSRLMGLLAAALAAALAFAGVRK
jgi:small neutral amino acid transporter SnatA (MarC family)